MLVSCGHTPPCESPIRSGALAKVVRIYLLSVTVAVLSSN